MRIQGRRVAAFRSRLAARQASWLIDISPRRTIHLDLTREQQALLGRATRRRVQSLAVVFQSDARSWVRTALCTLETCRAGVGKSCRRAGWVVR